MGPFVQNNLFNQLLIHLIYHIKLNYYIRLTIVSMSCFVDGDAVKSLSVKKRSMAALSTLIVARQNKSRISGTLTLIVIVVL